MKLSRGFQAGSAAMGDIIDTYYAAKQKREINDVMEQKPESSTGYTAEDGQQINNIANARDAQGNPYYNVTASPDGGYSVGANFQLDGQTPAAVGMSPRTVTDFAGKRFAGELNDDQLSSARYRAVSDVMTKYDPVKGFGMRREVARDERDAKRFDWEEQAQPLKQRTAELQVSGLERTEQQGVRDDQWRTDLTSYLKAWDTMGEDEKSELVRKLSYDQNVKGHGTWVKDTGKVAGYMTYLPDGGDPIKMSNNDARQVFALTKLMEVDPIRARAEMDKVSTNVRDFSAKAFDAQVKGVGLNNTALHSANMDRNSAITAGAAATNAATNRAYKDAQIGQITDAQGRRDQAAEIYAQYEALTPEEQNGPKGRGLRTQFNMVNAKAGGQISMSEPRGASGSASVKYQTDNIWADAEKKLMSDGASLDQIQQQKQGFYARRGFAPDAAIEALATGRDAKGKSLTAADVEAFKRTYPNTDIDTSKLTWLKPGGMQARPDAAAQKQKPVSVLSEAGSSSRFTLGRPDIMYNVAMPDGTTRQVSASDLAAQGFPMEQVGGQLRYNPNYK